MNIQMQLFSHTVNYWFKSSKTYSADIFQNGIDQAQKFEVHRKIFQKPCLIA